MKKVSISISIVLILSMLLSCISVEGENPAIATNAKKTSELGMFKFFAPNTSTKVVSSREKIVANLYSENLPPFAAVSTITPEKASLLINNLGVDIKKLYTDGSNLPSLIDGKIIEIDALGKTPWGQYIILEGSHKYYITSGEKEVTFRVIVCNLKTIVPTLRQQDVIKVNTILGTVKLGQNISDSTNFFIYTREIDDVFLNYSTPSKPVNYLQNRWFHVSTVLNDNADLMLGFPERRPHEVAYDFCHWHDETGAERRDPPPQGFSDFIFIDAGLRFYLLPGEKPHVMSQEEQNKVEAKIGYYRKSIGFGNFAAVTTWSDDTYTYYLFWGPTMNKYIQDEFDPKTPMLVSARVLTSDVATNSLVLYVGDFSYKLISEKLALVANTVIDLDKE